MSKNIYLSIYFQRNMYYQFWQVMQISEQTKVSCADVLALMAVLLLLQLPSGGTSVMSLSYVPNMFCLT